MPEKQGHPKHNDTSFKPGQSGNPGGQPKGWVSLTAILKRKLVERANDTDPHTVAEEIIDAFIKGAKKEGGFSYQKEAFDRTEGKPAQALELSGPGGGAIETKHTVIWE